jgi:TfoX/Sxy family transcriptional regulator of competence genes
MSNNPNLVQYIAEQCAGAGKITVKKMFGDYGIYCDGKIFGLICDDRLFVKPTEARRQLLRSENLMPPYEGAKNHFFIEDIDDKDYLSKLIRATCEALPEAKPKKKKEPKKLLILFAFLLLSPTLFAQRFGGGLMVGPTFSTMKISGNDTTSFRTNISGGVRIALIPEHFIIGGEIDIIYSRQGMRSKKGFDENGNTIRNLHKSHYINVPVLLNIYFRRWHDDDDDETMIPRLRIGPQIGFCIGGNKVQEVKGRKKQQHITPWESGSFNRIDYGLTAAFSYWFIEVRYTYGLANVFKEGEKSTNHVISVTWSDIW